MKLVSLVEVAVVNAVLIPLLALITENYGLRMAYWAHEGFTPTMTRYPLFFITSAVNGSTRIPGLLSVDWQQVILLLILLTDAFYAWSVYKDGKRARRGP
ncbi:MAG: hypothetical protein JRM86_06080 [Nitrososphaerota archaeon]|nr:hypothetical protein [Nitrososphaerota archaeon]MDG6967256.1 hypothetical protein [Nitrososphaerota archaeon]MDG6977901.1 hypothetical protein [Nitrososphaerota archaeon]MDG7006487.1 hypothetical protein [Nitrososphaerota archaeon]MDG7021741.1 hypothetical protein [Nitrososphaerota archaeon]